MSSRGGITALALGSPRFDWGQFSVWQDASDLVETLSEALGCDDVEAGRGLNGYEGSLAVKRRGETLVRVLHGGRNAVPHLIATGAATVEVVPVVRSSWEGRHEVTRIDSAQDFDEAGAFDALRSLMVATHEEAGLSIYEMESTRNGVRSRTVYLGAPASRVRVRLYEKGRLEAQEGREASETWVRLEIQVRPTGQRARRLLATLDESEVWGSARWARSLALAAMGADVDPVTMQVRREPDYARALESLARQYRRTLAQAIEVEGSWEAVGRALGVLDDGLGAAVGGTR